MPDKVIYYAIVNDLSSREQPAGVFRRTYTEEGGLRDEAFTRNLVWKDSASLVSAERGDLDNKFIEITEDEASQIMERSAPGRRVRATPSAGQATSLARLEVPLPAARCTVSSLA